MPASVTSGSPSFQRRTNQGKRTKKMCSISTMQKDLNLFNSKTAFFERISWKNPDSYSAGTAVCVFSSPEHGGFRHWIPSRLTPGQQGVNETQGEMILDQSEPATHDPDAPSSSRDVPAEVQRHLEEKQREHPELSGECEFPAQIQELSI